MTRQRRLVFERLQQADRPLSITQLIDQLPMLDKATVYRIIELFEKVGLVHRVWHGFRSKIELSDAFSPHHHHFTCLECGSVTGLKSEQLEKDLEMLEEQGGFKLTHHTIELSGYCLKCKDRCFKR